MRRLLMVLTILPAVASADHAPTRAERAHMADAPGTIGLSVGAGMNGFVGAEARGVIGPGPGWEARVTTLDNRHVRAELAYLGSTQELVDDAGVSLRSHGIQGSLRVNVAPSFPVEPFFYLGAGVARLSVTRNDRAAYESPDYVLDMPFGLGAAYHVGPFVIDVRAAITIVTGAQIVTVMDESANLSRFSARASVGVEL